VAQVADVASPLRLGVPRPLGLLQHIRREGRHQAARTHGFDGEVVQVGHVHEHGYSRL
jgi:hypothetical protein